MIKALVAWGLAGLVTLALLAPPLALWYWVLEVAGLPVAGWVWSLVYLIAVGLHAGLTVALLSAEEVIL